jgi:hypothetical protein
MHEDREESRRLAARALAVLEGPNQSLEVAIALAAEAAELAVHASECAWLRMQLADIPMERVPEIPENVRRIWDNIDASFQLDRDQQRSVRKAASANYSESRALPSDGSVPGAV